MNRRPNRSSISMSLSRDVLEALEEELKRHPEHRKRADLVEALLWRALGREPPPQWPRDGWRAIKAMLPPTT